MDGKAFSRIMVFGNCQGEQLVACLRRMLPTVKLEFVRYSNEPDALPYVEDRPNRLMLVQNPKMAVSPRFEEMLARNHVIHFPVIVHAGFHPDLIRPVANKKLIQGPLGSNHSALVLHGYLSGLNERETQALFREDVFARVGYFDFRAASDNYFRTQFKKFGILDENEITPLLAGGCFMHSTLHPKLPAIAMLARVLLAKARIEPRFRYPDKMMADTLANNVVWPVYPEIAAHFGLDGAEYMFQHKAKANRTFDLSDFISESFAVYRETKPDRSCHPRMSSDGLLQIGGTKAVRTAARSNNPYRTYPDHQFWRRGVASASHGSIDPVVKPAFTLDRSTRIVTAGSCFAQHVARRLAASGHHYLVSEAGDDLSVDERKRRNFGVYSARYGNIYTVRQLCQLFDRAHGTFVPREQAWKRGDGRFIDPFRPEIEPEGFATSEDVSEARNEHLAAVRALFRDADVFVFTLGLTEAWAAVADGAVFPVCPMVVSSDVESKAFVPVNFTHEEVLADLTRFVAQLRSVNPNAKVLLTVSPVPLVATFEDRHVLVSTAASKAILRSAADAICRIDPAVSYFPSYEIVSDPYFSQSYFDPADARSVLPEGVDHVMRLMLQHYSTLSSASPPSQFEAELDEEQKVICEEERLDS